MGNKSSLLLREEEIAQIQEETGCEYQKFRNSASTLNETEKISHFPQENIINFTPNEFSVSLSLTSNQIVDNTFVTLLFLTPSRYLISVLLYFAILVRLVYVVTIPELYSIKINRKASTLFIVLVTPNQIERLYSRFTSLDRSDCGTLSREDFLRIPELAINPLCDRIVHSFIADSNDDRVNFRQFMQVLARFRTIKKGKENRLNSREEKLRCENGFMLL